MPLYQCRVRELSGRIKTLLVNAENQERAVAELAASQLFPVSIKEYTRTGKSEHRLSRQQVLAFTSSLSVMLDSGLTLKDSMDIGHTLFRQPKDKEVMVYLSRQLGRGFRIDQVLAGMPETFDSFYTGLVRIGERTGSLADVFKRLSEYLQKQKEIRDKIISASIYPLLVLGASLLGIMLLSVFIFPAISNFFSQMGQSLPDKINRVLFNLKVLRLTGIVLPLLLLVSAVSVLVLRRKRDGFRLATDKLLLKVPFLGGFVRDMVMYNLVFSLEILTANGLTLDDSLKETIPVIRNRAFRRALEKIREAIIKGISLSTACSGLRILPDEFVRWISVSENTGRLDTVFVQLRLYYQQEVDKKAARLTGMIEPILIILVGGLMVGMILLFVLPIFSVYEVFL
jgi:type II secretory pathway component PulF